MNIPENIREQVTAGIMASRVGRVAEAEQAFQMALQTQEDPTTRILLASLLPIVYNHQNEAMAFRQRLMGMARQLQLQQPKLDLNHNWAVPIFHAAYQGLNDLELQKLWASLYAPPLEPMLRGAAPGSDGRRIHVGLVSAFFKDHTIGLLNRGLIARLPRDRFSVTVFTTRRHTDPFADFIRDHCDAYVELPNSPSESRRMMSLQKLDLIYFADIGMDPMTYTLAQSRYAPVQCTTWGHPVTSGLSAIDYFISSEALESPESQNQYSEQLVKLPKLAVYYYRPPMLATPPMSDMYGLPNNAHLYGCPQSLYKLHPDFDVIMAGILRMDPQAIIVLLQPAQMEWKHRLTDRLVRTMPDVFNRIIWLPRLNRQAFLGLMRLIHVSLDPLHFGGGNTSYEALAMGTPVVTLPGNTMRSRLTYAMYQQMNYQDMIVQSPEQYIKLAVRLGSDPIYLAAVRAKILAACPVLFEDQQAIDQLGDFFVEAVAKAPHRQAPLPVS